MADATLSSLLRAVPLSLSLSSPRIFARNPEPLWGEREREDGFGRTGFELDTVFESSARKTRKVGIRGVR